MAGQRGGGGVCLCQSHSKTKEVPSPVRGVRERKSHLRVDRKNSVTVPSMTKGGAFVKEGSARKLATCHLWRIEKKKGGGDLLGTACHHGMEGLGREKHVRKERDPEPIRHHLSPSLEAFVVY